MGEKRRRLARNSHGSAHLYRLHRAVTGNGGEALPGPRPPSRSRPDSAFRRCFSRVEKTAQSRRGGATVVAGNGCKSLARLMQAAGPKGLTPRLFATMTVTEAESALGKGKKT